MDVRYLVREEEEEAGIITCVQLSIDQHHHLGDSARIRFNQHMWQHLSAGVHISMHAALTSDDKLIIMMATLLPDPCREMDMRPPYMWSQRSLGISQEEAYEAYTNGKAPRAPAGRFGHSSSVHNNTLYIYGGHDGGQSRHGRQASTSLHLP